METIQASSPFVILGEGKDEKNFFCALLRHMNLIDRIDVREVGGKDQFPDEFPAFLNDVNFSHVKGYAIFRDADASAHDTFKSIQSLLLKHQQPCPLAHATFAYNRTRTRKAGVYIMPGDPTGMLEDLCLRSVKDDRIMPHVKSFMEQVRQTTGKDAPKNPSKATVQAFLSGMHGTYPSLGIAAQRRIWPFDNEAFNDLRHFLEELVHTF